MNRVAEFEKVSFKQFLSAVKDVFDGAHYKRVPGRCNGRNIFDPEPIINFIQGKIWRPTNDELIETLARSMYETIELPSRATSGSAGYDFKAPFGLTIEPGYSAIIPTGIRVKLEDGWWLACLPRSGHGFKYEVHLANTCGVIDSDYYYSDNEGHIFAKLVNFGTQNKPFSLEPGDKFMQTILLPYGITYSDDVQTIRNGGMGSTGA